MLPKTGKGKLSDRARQRRNKTRQRRKRRFGVVKKIHTLKRDCGYESALILFHPENGDIHTYRSTDHELWAGLVENIKQSNPGSQHLNFEGVENILKTNPSIDSAECQEISNDEEAGLEEEEVPALQEEDSGPEEYETALEEEAPDPGSPICNFPLIPILPSQTTSPLPSSTETLIPQNGTNEEISNLRKELERIQNRKIRLWQLEQLDKEEDMIRIRLEEIQFPKGHVIS